MATMALRGLYSYARHVACLCADDCVSDAAQTVVCWTCSNANSDEECWMDSVGSWQECTQSDVSAISQHYSQLFSSDVSTIIQNYSVVM